MKKLLFFLLFLTVIPCLAWGAETYYVAKTGHDTNNDCTEAQNISTPKLTLASGYSCMSAAGTDILYVRTGTYSEPINSSTALPFGTAWPNAARISAYRSSPTAAYEVVKINRGTPATAKVLVLSGSSKKYIIFAGIIFDGEGGFYGPVTTGNDVIKLEGGANHIRFEDCEVRNAEDQGVSIQGPTSGTNFNEVLRCKVHDNGKDDNKDHGLYIAGTDNTIEGNDVYNNFAYGIHVYGGSGGVHRNIVRRNRSHGNTKNGILIGSGTGNQAHNNIVYDNGVQGITVGYDDASGPASNNQVYNNTIYSNSGDCIDVRSSATTTTIKNNICYANSSNIIDNVGSSTVSANNLLASSNPGFVSVGSFDFSLTSSASAAINAGTTVPTQICNGVCDLGAHETFTCTGAGNTGLVPVEAPNTLKISCTQNVTAFYPLLPATNCQAGFTVRKAGVANAVNSCAISGNTITLTLANSYSSGNSADWYYDSAVGTISNSALMGNVTGQNQKLHNIGSVGTPIIAVNQAGGSTPTLTQVAFQFRSFGGSEAAPDSVSPLNTNVIRPPGACSVVRGQISNSVADVGDTTSFALYAQKNGSGGFTAIPNGPCTSTGICFITGTGTLPPELVAGPTTEQLAGSGTFVAGGVQLDASETPDVLLTTGKDTELVAVVCTGSGNANDAYFDLRWEKQGGTDLTTYTQIPKITISDTGYELRVGAR